MKLKMMILFTDLMDVLRLEKLGNMLFPGPLALDPLRASAWPLVTPRKYS